MRNFRPKKNKFLGRVRTEQDDDISHCCARALPGIDTSLRLRVVDANRPRSGIYIKTKKNVNSNRNTMAVLDLFRIIMFLLFLPYFFSLDINEQVTSNYKFHKKLIFLNNLINCIKNSLRFLSRRNVSDSINVVGYIC